jgi:hypothetical protein
LIRTLTLAALGLALVAGQAAAADNPQVTALKNEIKTIKAQKEATIKAIKESYAPVIRRDRFVEEELIILRKALLREEEALLAIATSEADKVAIHELYDSIRAILRVDTKIDASIIRKLHEMESNQVKLVRAQYDAKIKQLEAALHAAEHAPKVATPKKK